MTMSGIASLRRIQIGEESTKGDAVAATAALLGALTMKQSPTIYKPPDERGNMSESTRSVKVAQMADLVWSGELTFEQVLYWLHMGVAGNITPVSGESNYVWNFAPALTAAGTFDSFTIEAGDDIQANEVEYCMASQIEISGGMNEPLKATVTIFGRQMTQCSFTGSLTPPDVEDVLTQMGRVYIDDEDGVIGTTEKSATLISFTLTINTGLTPVRYGDGTINFSSYQEGKKSVSLRMTLAFNAGVEAERASYHDGETLRLVRLEFLGGNVAAASETADTVADSPLTDSATTINITTDADNFAVGETIQIGDEKCRVTAIDSVYDRLTVVRGVYGTTPASHIATTPIDILNEKRLTIDICGIWDDFESLGERDGEDVIDCTLTSQLGANYTSLYEVEVVNGVSTLP
jgi:hypothetical protein